MSILCNKMLVGANSHSHLGPQRWVHLATTEGPMTKYHLLLQSLQKLPPQRALHPCTTHCPQLLENTHSPLFPLLRASGATPISLGITSSAESPAIRWSLQPHHPMGCHHCQGPSDKALPESATHFPYIPGGTYMPCTCTPLIKRTVAFTH